MIKLAVFDWNGTILADTAINLAAAEKELAIIGLPPISPQDYPKLFEVPLQNLFLKLGASQEILHEKASEMAHAFHSHYEPLAAKARTRRGARQTLAMLQQEGIACIILSNHTLEGIYAQLVRLKLSDYFSDVLANEVLDGAVFKGKQFRLETYIEQHNVNPAETVIIGDTTEEVVIGQNLGLKTIALSGGFNSIDRLKAMQPDVLIHTLPDIVKAIKELA
jgi:phosphoglycolate phosphatase